MNRNLSFAGLISLSLLAACSTPNVEVQEQQLDPHYMNFTSHPQFKQMNVLFAGSDKASTIQAYEKNGKLMFQGDLMIASDTDHDRISQQAGIVTSRPWSNKTIPYVIDASLSGQTSLINQAVNQYNSTTNVRWVPRTNQANYVRFFKENGCWSYVGMIGGQQNLSLGDGCYSIGTALHEMTHAAGAHHEQSRTDRDQWITINWNNIPTDWHSQFQIISEAKPYGAYDFYSIMHYGLYWGNNLAMTPKVAGIDYNRVGRGTALTATDVAGINSIYPGSTGPATSITNGGVYRVQNVGSNKCLDVDNVSTANGASIKQYACIERNTLYNQDYRFKQVNTPEGVYYQIQAVHSGKCADISGINKNDGAKLNQWDCQGNPDDPSLRNQLFRPAQVATAVWQFGIKHSGKCLDVPSGSTADVQLQQWTCNASNAQRFRLIPVSH
ncbi:M12 family metallopeptidase [Deinococcus roseus]|uniref:Peptidase M12A domain-containing protein n=1 Tax=Deinococcus roseus TaxID=392414 RepID=A0ABQ2D6A5_9DEIO|nr:M12 family metallopeptidase [Deinococcus roseus]GGJ45219.1 hypothetical protein GCM10008938_34350 [Deinococcus roseus]